MLQVTQTDFMIAKHMAKKETDGHLVHYDSAKDLVEVYVQVFYGHEKWKLGVLRSPIDKVQGKFSLQAASSAGISEGRLNEDSYHALFAYCLLTG